MMNILLVGALIFPLVHGLIQICFASYLHPLSVYWRLKRINFFAGLSSLGIMFAVLGFFYRRRAAVERSFLTFLFYKLGDFFLLTVLLYLANMMHIESFSDLEKLSDFQHGTSLILCLFAVAAFVKSGLLPFSFWLDR